MLRNFSVPSDANIVLASLLVYLLGLLFTSNFVLIFIITILLLAADFYYLKNIAGRRLVGLRWWNEVNAQSGDSHWVFESAPQPNEPGGKLVNATDKRFFWLALYAQPALWVALAIVAIVRFEFIWLTLVGMLCGTCYEGAESRLLTSPQSLRWSSLLRTRSPSLDAISSAKRAGWWSEACTLAAWHGMWEARLSPGFSGDLLLPFLVFSIRSMIPETKFHTWSQLAH